MTTNKQPAWWSDTGPDNCEFCEVSYYAETGYYCEICDRGVCSSCVITGFEPRRVICPHCREIDEKEGDS